LKHEHKRECTKCKVIPCFNLYKKSENVEDAGGELYVYNLLGAKIDEKEKEIGTYVCSNGRFLEASCFLSHTICFDLKEKSYLKDVLFQVPRDFKASMFLAYSGHYRQALQILRCAFENLISGTYFHSDLVDLTKQGKSLKDLNQLERRFKQWKKGGPVAIRKNIEILRRIHLLDMEEERKWKELYHDLSRFVHTPGEFVSRETHGGELARAGEVECAASTYFNEKELARAGEVECAASTYFNEKELSEWSAFFQRIFAILIKIVARYHPEVFDTIPGKLAVDTCILPELRENGEKIPVREEILGSLPPEHKRNR